MSRADTARESLGLGELRPGFGNHIRHRHTGRWELKAPKKGRVLSLNTHRKRVLLNGRWVRVQLTTREMRTLLKNTK